MSRDTVLKNVLQCKSNNILLEFPTGLGKSKVAIDLVKKFDKSETGTSTLYIVVYRKVHINNWNEELNKWWKNRNINIKFITYASLHKMLYYEVPDYIIYDECHHLSERCLEIVSQLYAKHSILLSATVSKDLKFNLKSILKGLTFFNMSLREAIEDNILPDPTVYLLPLELDKTKHTEVIVKNPKGKGEEKTIYWENRYSYRKVKSPLKILCTERQYLAELNQQADLWKKLSCNGRNKTFRNRWLKICGDRLKWLSDKKTIIVKELLKELENYRTLTFCNSIKQTELLGEYCINSKNKQSTKYLEDFNSGKINHITACDMLNEGMNLVDCQIGIYANLNSSETIIKQRSGRLLRHKNPIIIIPYYVKSRDEELVEKMLENYNPELIKQINSIKEIKL